MKIINLKDIIEVTKEGILYKDSVGNTEKVLFMECRKNWVSHVNQGGFADGQGKPVQITLEQSKCIGERNMMAKPPYLLLYSDERLKIEMQPGLIVKRTKAQREFLRTLYEVGVSTFDMT